MSGSSHRRGAGHDGHVVGRDFYEVSGAGEPVVLIHAFSVDRRMWAPQIASLEKRFRVVRYDQRGHGKSDGPSAPYAQHEDLRSVLDALGIDKATLIGLSAGATTATDFAIAYPNRVDARRARITRPRAATCRPRR